MEPSKWGRLGRVLLWLGLAAVLVWAVIRLQGILTSFAVAFVLAYFLNPAANALERIYARVFRRFRWIGPRAVAVGTIFVGLVLVVVLVALIVVPTVYRQVTETAAKVPAYVEKIRAQVEPAIQRLNLRYPKEFEETRQRLIEAVRSHIPEIVAPIPGIVGAAFSSVLSLVLTVLSLFVIPVFAGYLLYDMNRINAGIAALVPHRYRDYVYSRARAVTRLISAFVRGQVTVCLILGSFYAIALTACGVPMGLAVGFLVGSFNLIPNMSTAVGLPLVLTLSWIDDQSWRTLLVLTGLFFFGQIVEGNFITPRIVGQRVGLHAVVIMLAVLVGGTLFGFIGMVVAVPSTAALSVFWADAKAWYLASDFFKRGASGEPGAGGGAAA
jgi:predicted PurR-regulated permease PerM